MFLLALVVYLATTGGSMATDIMSFEVTKGIVDHGTVAMSYNVFQMEAHRGVDGRYYSPYGIGHPIFSIPFYAAARAAEQATGLAPWQAGGAAQSRFRRGQCVCGRAHGLGGVSVRVATVERPGRLNWTAIGIAFGTLLWPYAKFGFNAPLGTFCVLWGLYGRGW